MGAMNVLGRREPLGQLFAEKLLLLGGIVKDLSINGGCSKLGVCLMKCSYSDDKLMSRCQRFVLVTTFTHIGCCGSEAVECSPIETRDEGAPATDYIRFLASVF